MDNYRKRLIIILITFSSIVFVLCSWLAYKILDESISLPSTGLTLTTMRNIQKRIFIYMQEHGHTPRDLRELPNLDGYYNSIKDGWGNQILYSVETNGVVTLTSLGADGKPGGIGQAGDIIQSFSTTKYK